MMKNLRNCSNVFPFGLLILFAVGPASISAQSETITARGPIPFAAYDKDGDGFISKEEFYSAREERMSKRIAEGRTIRGTANAPVNTDVDSVGDSRPSSDEMVKGQRAQIHRGGGMGQGRGMGRNMPDFTEFDLDGDGTILEDEFYEARNNRISERAKQGYRMRNLVNAPSFADIDTSGDGAISSEEFAVHQAQCYQQVRQP